MQMRLGVKMERLGKGDVCTLVLLDSRMRAILQSFAFAVCDVRFAPESPYYYLSALTSPQAPVHLDLAPFHCSSYPFIRKSIWPDLKHLVANP